VSGGGGRPRGGPRGGGGARRMWINKFLNVNIINFENVDKPEGGEGRTMWISLFS
jgi:hypothetical protein